MISQSDSFTFVLEKSQSKVAGLLAPHLNDVPDNSIAEISPASIAVANGIGRHIHDFGGAALFIDYGYRVFIQATHCKQFGNTRLSMSSTHR